MSGRQAVGSNSRRRRNNIPALFTWRRVHSRIVGAPHHVTVFQPSIAVRVVTGRGRVARRGIAVWIRLLVLLNWTDDDLIIMAILSQADEAQLKGQLQDAVVACTDRSLYQSAKW